MSTSTVMPVSVDHTTVEQTAERILTDADKAQLVLDKIEEMISLANFLKKSVRPLLKKKGKKTNANGETTRKNGFQAPVSMTPALVDFVNRCVVQEVTDPYTETTIIPRTEVTQMLTTYIKSSNLQIPENRKNFRVDDNLSKLFPVETGYVTNWFEMQKFISPLLISKKDAAKDTNTNTSRTVTNNATNNATNNVNNNAEATPMDTTPP